MLAANIHIRADLPVLASDPYLCGMHVVLIDRYLDSMIEGLGQLGLTYRYVPDCTGTEATLALADAEVLVLRSKLALTADQLRQAPRLRLVIRTGAGLDHLDLPALAAAGIRVVPTLGANSDAVGEHALGLLLGLLHHIPRSDAEVRRGQWLRQANMGEELGGKVVGIVGYGHTGRAFARRLAGLGVRVLAYDRDQADYADAYADAAPLAALQAQCQVLSLHIPLDPANHHWLDARRLAGFAQPLWLINTSRGPVVDTQALLSALASGRVLGAALDVLENEKLDRLTAVQQRQMQALQAHPSVILTPHIAGWSWQAEQRFVDQTLGIVRRYLAGEEI